MKMILVTGGLGYIGSHTVVELIAEGYEVVIADSLTNSKRSVLERLNKITGKSLAFEHIDVSDKTAVARLFDTYSIEGVIHFAGLKAVGESVAKPILYYQANLDSTLVLCEVMQEKGIKNLVFSSSATVYGNPEELPLKEDSQTGQGITNPYGQTKYMIEQILRDITVSDTDWRIAALRYFNPIGAHESGTLGEDPNDTPNNLLPYISQVAVGKLEKLKIFGDDYDTIDGTGVRDYIHVVDLAKGHIAALKHLEEADPFEVFNLGTGKGTSVLELLHAFEAKSEKKIPYEIVARRPGDVASCFADATKAKAVLDWSATLSIEQACADSWRWQQFATSIEAS